MKHRIGCWRGIERFAAALNETCSDELWVGRGDVYTANKLLRGGRVPELALASARYFTAPQPEEADTGQR